MGEKWNEVKVYQRKEGSYLNVCDFFLSVRSVFPWTQQLLLTCQAVSV